MDSKARKMIKLNLPAFEAKLKREGDKRLIFDIIRKKYIILSPEEWVRQHVLNYLINIKHYPKGLFKVESQHFYHAMAKRSDILIMDNEAKPWMLVECKAPEVKIATSSLKQIAVYNKSIGAKYLLLCNGMEMFCWKAGDEMKDAELLHELPEFNSF